MSHSIGGIEVSSEDPSSRFEFESKVGEGSYGAVYKAIDLRTNKVVAVKVLDLQGDTNQIADLQREINILKTCVCPQIVEYCGAYSKDGQLWIAMEFCGAGSLSDLMAICDTILDEDEIAAVMYQCLKGLEYLHKTKKIHRDIKSGNMLLTDDGRCKLADFGVSAELTATLAKAATMIGTPYFMAPEVLMNSQYDAKADIWSVGITAYELALGQPPLADVHPMRAIFQIPNSPPPRLPDDQGFTPEFTEFITNCLQKDPAHRMTATELMNLPFFAPVRDVANLRPGQLQPHQEIILDLLHRCKDTIDAWRVQEQEEQIQMNENNPYGRENNGEQDNGDMNGTVAFADIQQQQFFDPAAEHRSNVQDAQNLQARYADYNDGTVVIKAAPKNDGTVVVKKAPQTEANDYGTVVIKKSDPQTQTGNQHFGSLKVNGKGTMVNNSGTMIARPNNSANINDLQFQQFANLTIVPKHDIERVKQQLHQARANDLRVLNNYYDTKLKELEARK